MSAAGSLQERLVAKDAPGGSINDAPGGSINDAPHQEWNRAAASPIKKKERLLCLDAVRGLNVMLMIFVDNVGSRWNSWIDHSPWDVIHLADFVMPLFLL